MKKLLTYSSLVILFSFITSCKPSPSSELAPSPEVAVESNSITIQDKIKNILTMSSGIEQKLAYSTLDSNEKVVIWQQHFTDVLQNDGLNSDQVNIVLKVKSSINAGLFNIATNIKSNYIRTIKSDLYQLFDRRQLNIIFSSLQPIVHEQRLVSQKLQLNTGGSGGRIVCDCNVPDDFCSDGNCVFQGASCYGTGDGCGFLFLENCNGKCIVPAN